MPWARIIKKQVRGERTTTYLKTYKDKHDFDNHCVSEWDDYDISHDTLWYGWIDEVKD